MKNDFPKEVRLIGVLSCPGADRWEVEDFAVSGAMGCFDEKSSSEIHRKHAIEGVPYGPKNLNWAQTREVLMKETSGRGHGAVCDQSEFVFSIDNLSRASTLFLCGPEYASHLQQSLRRASAERGYVGVSDIEGNRIMQEQFELYDQMKDAGVPTEDARIILPLNTKTAIQTKWNARELVHLKSIADRMNVPGEVEDTVNQMYNAAYGVAPALMKDRGINFEVLSWFPSSQLFARQNATLERLADEGNGMQLLGYHKGLEMTSDEIEQAVKNRDEALLANLKHYHFSFSIPMSLMSFHQATRQRTWNQSVEPLAHAVKRGVYVVPESVAEAGFAEDYGSLVKRSLDYVRSNKGSAEAQGIIPHGLEVYDAIHVNGWNAIHSIGKRTCKTAQWEIRDKATYMAREIRRVAPEVGKYSRPQGIIYGTCPERENCGACGK